MNRYFLKAKVSRLASFAALFVVIGLMVFVPQGSIFAATIPITNLTGVVAAGDGLCTLPEAINNANAGGDTTGGDCPAGAAGSDTIVLGGSVTLTTPNVVDAVMGRDGLPTITSAIIIEGNGFTITRSTAGCSAIPGNAATEFRIFRLTAAGNLTLNNMTISNGCANAAGSGRHAGAVYNDGGTLRVTNSTLTGNHSYDDGGAFYSINNGRLTVVSSVFTNNTAQAGGGFVNAFGSQASVYNSTFTGNTVFGAARGGAIYNRGDGMGTALTLVNSVLTNNVADDGAGGGAGGGIYTYLGARADITDSVISNNRAARDAGGIWIESAGTVTNLIRSTVSGNTSGFRLGGLYIWNTGASVQTIVNSTISGNTSANVGAIFNDNSTVNITHSTISNSTSLLDPTRSGILTANGAGPVTTINGSIVANNDFGLPGDIDCRTGAGASTVGANNFDSTNTCPGPAVFITPGTHYSTALASNGGPTQTHQLIGPVGRDAAAGCGLATDQRGVPRDANCDAGSYEISTITPVQVSFWPDNAAISEPVAGVATITVQYNNPNAVNLDVTAYFTITGSASGSGIDYTLAGLGTQQQITYTVPPGISTRTFTITAVDDTPLVDPGETVVMNLSRISGYAQVVGVNPQTVTITEAAVAVPTEAAAPAGAGTGAGAGPAITVFDPAISKLGFFTRGQVGIVGEQIEWVVTVTNVGTGAGTNVVVADTVPSSMRVDKVVTSLGTAVVSGQTVTVTIPTLAPGQSMQFSIFTTVLQGTEVSNTACVTAVNLVGERCATALPVQTLPITGQTPWWRMWVIVFSGLAVVGGLSLCARRAVLVRWNHV